uniref:Translation initiation factor eIF2B subunit alpha n=1 Tax=Capra hircus TaxID=9925 RepID=A0A452EFB0_CAPHI
MDNKELIEYFKSQIKEDPDMASAVAAIQTLLEYLRRDTGETTQGLRANLTRATETQWHGLFSGGELFLCFISHRDERGEIFLRRISLSRNKIADLCHTLIKDGARVLIGAESLGSCPGTKKHFTVYITESQPVLSGKKMVKALCSLSVPFTVVPDAAVGYIMEKVDLVIVGAEGVVENRGTINKVGASVFHRSLLTKCFKRFFREKENDRIKEGIR